MSKSHSRSDALPAGEVKDGKNRIVYRRQSRRGGGTADVRPVVVEAADEATEVFLIDRSLKRVSSGIGRLEYLAEPGFYKIRFRAGANLVDRMLEVEPGDEPLVVRGEPVPFRSTAPLTNTMTTDDVQAAFASEQSLLPPRRIRTAQGSQCTLFVLVRETDQERGTEPWRGVTIHDILGHKIADLSDGIRAEESPCASLHLQLAAGTYRIRVETGPLGSYEIFVVCCEGWQTQTFLITADFSAKGERVRRAELRSASVMMARPGTGFRPDAKSARLAELARLGLQSGRTTVHTDDNTSVGDMNLLLNEKFENPIHGILGVHILARLARPNRSLISKVVHNLRRLIGTHPDVEAVALMLQEDDRYPPVIFEQPPMLQSSWDMIALNSLHDRGLVPAGSVASEIGKSIVALGPWLMHRVEGETQNHHTTQQGDPLVSAAEISRSLIELIAIGERDGLRPEVLKDVSVRKQFTPLESAILTSATSIARANRVDISSVKTEPKRISGRAQAQRIMRQVDAPFSSIAASTRSLLDKLDIK